MLEKEIKIESHVYEDDRLFLNISYEESIIRL